MADVIKGFNIELGLDTLGVEQGMAGLRRTMSRVNSEFSRSLSTFDRGERSMGRYQTTLQGLNSKLEVQDKIVGENQRAYNGLSKEYDSNRKALSRASDEVSSAEREMDRLMGSTDATAKEFADAEVALREAETRFGELNEEVSRNRKELDNAEISLNRAEREYNNITRSVERYTEEMKQLHIEQSIANSGWTQAGDKIIGFSNGLQQISGVATTVGDSLTRNITLPAVGVATAVGGIVSAFGWGRLVDIDRAQAQLRGLGYETEDVERISLQLTDALEGGMLTMGEATSAAATAMAAGVEEGKELTRYIQILDGAVAGSTGTFEEMEQIFGRIVDQGTMTRNEFDMISQRMPGFSKAVQDHLGVSSEAMYEMLRNGEITTDQFLDVMEEFAGDMASEYAKSWEGMMQNTKAYIGILGQNLLEGVFQESKLSLEEFIDLLSSEEAINWARDMGVVLHDTFIQVRDTIMDVVDWYKELDEWQQELIWKSGLLAVAIGPVLSVVGRLGGGIATLGKAFGELFKWIGVKSGTTAALKSFGDIVGKTGGKVGLASAGTGLAGKTSLLAGGLSALGGPVGIAAFALGTTLVGGLVLAYNQSESFKGIVDEMITMIGEGFVNSVEAGTAALDKFGNVTDTVFDNFNQKLWDSEEPLMTFSETMDFHMREVVPAAMGYMWESVINSMDGFYKENIKGQSVVQGFGSTVSEETAKIIEDYMLLSEEASRLLMEMSYNQGEITDEQAEKLSEAYAAMNEESLLKLEEKRVGEIEKMNEIFAETYSLNDQSKNAIEERVQAHYNTEEDMLNSKNERIQEIIADANASEEGWTQQHTDAIERIQNDHLNQTTENLSASQIEQEGILQRASNNQQAISEETVSELIKDSVTARDRTIEEAKEKRDGIVNWATDQYNNHGSISEDEMNDIIADAEMQYGSTVDYANRKHDEVLGYAQSQAYEHGIIVDGETGDILSKWDVFKNNFDTILASIASASWTRAKEIGSNIANGVIDGINWMRTQFNKIPEALGISFRLPSMSGIGTNTSHGQGRSGRGGYSAISPYSSGTNYHLGGPALVGDKGPGNGVGGGSSTREIVELPNSKRYLVDGDIIFPEFPRGAKVHNNKDTEAILANEYAAGNYGSGSLLMSPILSGPTLAGQNKATKVGRSFGSMTRNIYDYMDDPEALISQLLEETSFGGITAVTKLGAGMANSLSSGMISKVKELFEQASSTGDGSHILNRIVTAYFGRYPASLGIGFNGGRHYGLDTAHNFDPLLSPINGVVTRRWNDFGGGKSLEIKSGRDYWWFMHLSRIMAGVGDSVKAGQRIATTGNSGNWTTGAHLHTQYMPGAPGNHNAENPLPVLKRLQNKGSYWNGGLISSHGYYEGAEGNRPEMVIPLTNKSRAIDLMFQVLSMIGGGGNKSQTTNNNNEIIKILVEKLNQQNATLERSQQILIKILEKEFNISIDGEKLNDHLSEIDAIKSVVSF